jgi:hypothetical protein
VIPTYIQPLCFAASLSLLTACVTDATTDVTKAPFRAVSDVTNGTTQATSDLTEPITNFTSSTSPKSWFNGDGTLRAEHKARAFTVFAYHNLKSDIASGSGEYLASLASLAGVAPQGQEDFFMLAQSRYAFIYEDGIRPAESVQRLLQTLAPPPS